MYVFQNFKDKHSKCLGLTQEWHLENGKRMIIECLELVVHAKEKEMDF